MRSFSGSTALILLVVCLSCGLAGRADGQILQPDPFQSWREIASHFLLTKTWRFGKIAKCKSDDNLGRRSPVKPEVRARFEARARILKAMAHPTRLYIVDVLAGGERCVHELTEMVGADMSTVSKHLSVLRSAGILSDEKRGSEVYYSLRMACVLGFFDCVEAVLKGEASCGRSGIK